MTFMSNADGSNLIAGALGPVIAYGLFKSEQHGYLSFSAWQVLFLSLGISTILSGIAVLRYLSDTPATAWFLTVQERTEAQQRISWVR
jgi:ACS family allantoate permease-like MFS transporter